MKINGFKFNNEVSVKRFGEKVKKVEFIINLIFFFYMKLIKLS